MATSVTCTRVVRAGGKARLRFSDKAELEFESIAQARDYVRSVLDKEVLRAILVAKALAAAADGSSLTALEGRTCTEDLSLASNVVRVT